MRCNFCIDPQGMMSHSQQQNFGYYTLCSLSFGYKKVGEFRSSWNVTLRLWTTGFQWFERSFCLRFQGSNSSLFCRNVRRHSVVSQKSWLQRSVSDSRVVELTVTSIYNMNDVPTYKISLCLETFKQKCEDILLLKLSITPWRRTWERRCNSMHS